MITCKACSKENPDSFKRCLDCGRKIGEAEATDQKTAFHRAATFSIYLLIFSFAASALNQSFLVRFESNWSVQAIAYLKIGIGLVYLAGVIAGIASLFGISRYGTRGILVKALIGILIPVAAAVPAVILAYSDFHNGNTDASRTALPHDISSTPSESDHDMRIIKAEEYVRICFNKETLGPILADAFVRGQLERNAIRASDATKLNTLVQPIFGRISADTELKDSLVQLAASYFTLAELQTISDFYKNPDIASYLQRIKQNQDYLRSSQLDNDTQNTYRKTILEFMKSDASKKFISLTKDSRYRNLVSTALSRHQAELDEIVASVTKEH